MSVKSICDDPGVNSDKHTFTGPPEDGAVDHKHRHCPRDLVSLTSSRPGATNTDTVSITSLTN